MGLPNGVNFAERYCNENTVALQWMSTFCLFHQTYINGLMRHWEVVENPVDETTFCKSPLYNEWALLLVCARIFAFSPIFLYIWFSSHIFWLNLPSSASCITIYKKYCTFSSQFTLFYIWTTSQSPRLFQVASKCTYTRYLALKGICWNKRFLSDKCFFSVLFCLASHSLETKEVCFWIVVRTRCLLLTLCPICKCRRKMWTIIRWRQRLCGICKRKK